MMIMLSHLLGSLQPVCVMASARITMFRDLNVLQEEYTIKVRIIRLWTRKLFKDPRNIYSYEMILMDENGSRMEASVQKKYCFGYENLLTENRCLLVFRPSLAANVLKNKILNTPHKISFNEKTVVMSCSNAVGFMYGFQFTPFSILNPAHTEENTTVDIIGAVMKFFPIDRSENANGKITKRNNEITVTLWDNYADQFDSFLSENQSDRDLVVIVQFGKFRTFIGANQVSNAYNVTKLFINDVIDEITSFKQRFISQSMSVSSSSHSGFSSSVMTTMMDDFLAITEFVNICEIHDIKTPKDVVLLGTVKGFCNDTSWYYASCRKCKSKVTENVVCTLKSDGSGDFDEVTILGCKGADCKGQTITSVPRYKIALRVQDCTGIVSLTLFDREAFRLLKISANQLLDNNEEYSAEGVIPLEFNSLLDRTFAMKIKVSEYNLQTNKEYYTISKLTDDPTIMSELEKKSEHLQHRDSESMNTILGDFEIAPVVTTKDSFSCTGDEVTPISKNDKCNHVSPKLDEATPSSNFPTEDLKRNLQSVYDVDEFSSQSSSKPRMTSNKDEDAVHCTTKLLTPKIEK